MNRNFNFPSDGSAYSSDATPTGFETPGQCFRRLVGEERPLQVVGAINPLSALLAEEAGFRALYLSGAGVANASHALPDLGITHLEDVVSDARRITAASQLPLLVDIDTGWGTEWTIARSIRELHRIGVAAVHLEDQVAAKRCGHRPGKQLVSEEEMQARILAATEARPDRSMVIMARTDAAAVEGVDAAIRRAEGYVAAGADMIFAEAFETLDDYRRIGSAVGVPILANLTEFGKTPAFSLADLRAAGVSIVLYPLTAFRAMNQAAKLAYQTLRRDGNPAAILNSLQTRDELYALLGYHEAERRMQLGRRL